MWTMDYTLIGDLTALFTCSLSASAPLIVSSLRTGSMFVLLILVICHDWCYVLNRYLINE